VRVERTDLQTVGEIQLRICDAQRRVMFHGFSRTENCLLSSVAARAAFERRKAARLPPTLTLGGCAKAQVKVQTRSHSLCIVLRNGLHIAFEIEIKYREHKWNVPAYSKPLRLPVFIGSALCKNVPGKIHNEFASGGMRLLRSDKLKVCRLNHNNTIMIFAVPACHHRYSLARNLLINRIRTYRMFLTVAVLGLPILGG
jgi:hypothetical protein